ncbi:hypothetical protein Pmi06nite_66510 [Planotetraspora mira]|uniref:Uncharacterized protein n=1 Tax=Planotetraspora mira TaxID=58121 RepID=A0A8J3TZE6_9ACTN|nr:hypothetical protein Pmi06nite_66510 [Planotetraspora mira]
MDRQFAALQHVDLALIDVETEDLKTEFGHACRMCGTQISGAKHGETVRHGMLPSYPIFVIWHRTEAVNCPRHRVGKQFLAPTVGGADDQGVVTPRQESRCPDVPQGGRGVHSPTGW